MLLSNSSPRQTSCRASSKPAYQRRYLAATMSDSEKSLPANALIWHFGTVGLCKDCRNKSVLRVASCSWPKMVRRDALHVHRPTATAKCPAAADAVTTTSLFSWPFSATFGLRPRRIAERLFSHILQLGSWLLPCRPSWHP